MEGYFTVSRLLCLLAVIGFVLAAFGVELGDTTPLEMVSGCLAVFAASFLVP